MAFRRPILEQVKSLDSKLTAIIPMWYVHVTRNESEYAECKIMLEFACCAVWN
jgi:hypothetical protein